MPEKSANKFSLATSSWIFGTNPMINRWFKALTLAVFLGILIIWGIDGWSINSFHKDFLLIKLYTTHQSQNLSQIHENFAPNVSQNQLNVANLSLQLTLHDQNQNLSQIHENFAPNVSQNQLNVANLSLQLTLDDRNLTQNPTPATLDWISAELEANYSSNLLANWLAPGAAPCKESKAVDIAIPGLDGLNQIELSTGDIHEFVFQALDEAGQQHCFGGDYFETDISGESWKSRPPVIDLGNGTYTFSLQIHPDFPGNYTLTIILLFRQYQGLKFSPERFAFDKLLRKIPIKFLASSTQLPEITQCRKSDFARNVWSGRWTRQSKNDTCEISKDGRYRCTEATSPCLHPWCHGYLGVLESNGWIYSTHCSFNLFSAESAWNCLSNRWIFFWGDSNHCDTIRNMLNFVLNVDIKAVPRRFDMNITNPNNPIQIVRITNVFNGHPNETGNYRGLDSVRDEEYRQLLKGYFSGDVVPDTMIMNSGLHDGVFWSNIRRFNKGAEDAAAFWAEVLEGVRRRGAVAPEVIYRSTVATGGYARRLAFNPNKMEAFNGVFLEKLRRFGVVNRVIDHFDMTYPWHYDNRCNDGVHYGRAPAKLRWRDGEIGHQYFVDLMLCHVLLNALCAR